MERENAESRVRQLDDQLAGMQEELRRETDNRADGDMLQEVGHCFYCLEYLH